MLRIFYESAFFFAISKIVHKRVDTLSRYIVVILQVCRGRKLGRWVTPHPRAYPKIVVDRMHSNHINITILLTVERRVEKWRID
jgi:hypothetical protein